MTKSYVPVPARTGLSVAMLLLYGLAGMAMWSRVIIKRGVSGFALAPWLALAIVRVAEAVFGLVTSIPSAQTQPYKSHFWFLYTFLWDLGLWCIVVALLRSLAFVLSPGRRRPKVEVAPYAWAAVLLVLLVIGSAFAGLYTFSSDQAKDAMDNRISEYLLSVAFAGMAATLVVLAGAAARALILLRGDVQRFSSADTAICLAFIPSFILLAIRLVPDIMRIFLYRSPSFPVFVGMQLVPELLLVSLWLYLGHLVTAWHFGRDKELAELRAHKRDVWTRHIEDAISYAQAARQKGTAAAVAHRKKPWILLVVENRMASAAGADVDAAAGLHPESAEGRREALTLLQRLKGLAGAIADNLVLEPQLTQPLRRRDDDAGLEAQQRPIDMQATERRVAEQLPVLFGMQPERAKKVARDWVIIFVLDWRTLT